MGWSSVVNMAQHVDAHTSAYRLSNMELSVFLGCIFFS